MDSIICPYKMGMLPIALPDLKLTLLSKPYP